MSRRFWLALGVLCVAVVWSASALRARPGVVKTTDGQTLEGDVDNDSSLDNVTVIGKGGTSIIPRNDVASIEWTGEVADEYRRRLAEMPKDAGAQEHIDLARWLFAQRGYDLERIELETALKLEPNNAEANSLFDGLVGQLRMERRTRMAASNAATASVPATGPAAVPATGPVAALGPATAPAATETSGSGSARARYLTGPQVNFIKQEEWRTDDLSVKVQYDSFVRGQFLQNAPDIRPAAFSTMSPIEQAMTMVRDGNALVRRGVHITNDPAPLAEFRRFVQPLVAAGCAAASCHGNTSAAPAGFFIYDNADSTEAVYTNFYLLTSYSRTVDKVPRLMIDRTYPELSLLAQYVLPAGAADVVHPQVPRGTIWRGLVRGKDDPHYRQLIRWMGKSLTPVQPDYGFVLVIGAQERSPATASTRPAH